MDAKIRLDSMCSHVVVAVVFDQFFSVCVCVDLYMWCLGNGAKEETQERQTQEPRERLLLTRARPPRLIRQRTLVFYILTQIHTELSRSSTGWLH